MPPASTGSSPGSTFGSAATMTATIPPHFSLSNHNGFSLDMSATSSSGGGGGGGGGTGDLKSPTASLKAQRTASFNRDGGLSGPKARNLSSSAMASQSQSQSQSQSLSLSQSQAGGSSSSSDANHLNGNGNGNGNGTSASAAAAAAAGLDTKFNEANDPSDDGINPLKRRNTDIGAVDYPRRRATIACEVCRSRKSRCDGTKPKCKLCTELGAECIYREPGIKLDAGDKLILERLNRIEGLLQMSLATGHSNGLALAAATAAVQQQQQQQQQQQHQHQQHQQQHPPPLPLPPPSQAHDSPSSLSNGGAVAGGLGIGMGLGDLWSEQPGTITAAAAAAAAAAAEAEAEASANSFVSVIPAGGIGTWTSGANNISTMPKVHTNAALHLLHWPLIRDLVSRPYDPQSLLQLEMARDPLNSLTKIPCFDLSNTAAYIEAYFERVNVWYACVNPYTWRSHYRTALSNGFREGPESCIVLLVLALGQASLRGASISRLPPHEDPPGLQYFTAAWALLPGMMTSNSVLAAQCHLLAAAYLFYLVRPLEAWNLLCTTSTKLQLLLMAPAQRVPPAERELTERIYWNALLFESDLLAELDLPHSGVVQFEENVGLPCGFEGDERQAVGRDDLWYFLAEIALRRLLNRVSQLIYSQDSMASTASLAPVVAELDYQLTQWYESLPGPLQFPFARTLLADPVQTVLRLRFFACRTIIYRPYILAVLDNEPAVLDPSVRECCHKCLEASVRQLEHITAHHAGHMPYLWQGALSIVSQTLLVMGASMSPSLSSILLTIVPHRDVLDQIITDVVAEIGRYAGLAPSLSLAAEIIREAEVRRRAFLSG